MNNFLVLITLMIFKVSVPESKFFDDSRFQKTPQTGANVTGSKESEAAGWQSIEGKVSERVSCRINSSTFVTCAVAEL